MNTRSSIIRKILYLLLLAVLALCTCIPVLATSGTTTLTTTVPSHFDLNVTIVGSGTVEVNGIKLSETGVVPTERGKEVSIMTTPCDGSYINSVIYDGTDITREIQSGHITLPQLECDASIIVKFTVDASTPNTGDNSYPSLVFFSVTAIISLLGIVVLLTVNRKKSDRM